MRDLRRCWMNPSILNRSRTIVLCAVALLAGCDRTDAPMEVPLPDAQQPQFSNNDRSPNANPFTFVGREGQGVCPTALGDPAGSRIVSAAWLGGMGLPDNGGPNSSPITDPADAPNKDDPHYGLLLSKNGRTPICASAGAVIVGVKGKLLTPESTLGFDYRKGSHCGGGAPRFNVIVKDPVTNMQEFLFVGSCASAVITPAEQDPTEWATIRFATGITSDKTLLAIAILYDEGTDTPSPVAEDPQGIGLAVIDNIWIDGEYIRSGGGIAFGAGGLEKKDSDADGLADDADTDDDNDGLEDFLDTDDNGDGIEDVLELKLMLPVLELP